MNGSDRADGTGHDPETDAAFEEWGVLELFGHSKVAGLISEQEIGGQRFFRVDIPAGSDGCPALVKLYGPRAVYGVHLCTEVNARRAAKELRSYSADTLGPKGVPVFLPDGNQGRRH